MSNKVVICSGNGVGDQTWALVVCQLLKNKGKEVEFWSCSRNEVFQPLLNCFGHICPFIQLDESLGNDNKILTSDIPQKVINSGVEFYFILPDLLMRGPHSFDYKKYNISLQTIKTTRILTGKWIAQKKIYVSLAVPDRWRMYPHIDSLLRLLGQELPDYGIIFPNIKQWNGKELWFGDFKDMPPNVFIDNSGDFINSINEHLYKSCYNVTADCGIMHLAHHISMPMLVLDHQISSPAYISRWRETTERSIPFNTSPENIVKVVKTNLQIPQTQLIPSEMVLYNLKADWSKELIFKY